MKALTVKQPWAYLICAGIKPIENRTWKTNRRERILIHAAATDFDFRGYMMSEYRREFIQNVKKPYIHGAIIGSVEIFDCVDSKDNPNSMWGDLDCQHWMLKNPILFKNPIENVKGKLSFWEYELSPAQMIENNLQKKVEFDKKDIELFRDILKDIKVLEQQAAEIYKKDKVLIYK